MSGSITDSPWMRLMEKCYENRGNYPVDPTDDSNPALEKAEEELEREIQAEIEAKLKKKQINRTDAEDWRSFSVSGENLKRTKDASTRNL